VPLLAICSVKSSPGVTTTALGLAAVLPAQVRPVLVECDPAGGDLAARHRLRLSPGLVGLATATRASAGARSPATNEEVLSRCTQAVAIGERVVEVVVAPCGGAQTKVALSVLARPGQVTLTPADRVVLADCGRVDFFSPAWPLLAVADAVLVLVRGRVDEVAHLREHLSELAAMAGNRLTVVLASGGVYRPDDVAGVLAGAAVTDAVVWGPLPEDGRAAAVFGGQRAAGRKWARLPLPVALGDLGADLSARLRPEATATGADAARGERV
jgi:hypothetical protein